MLRKKRKPGKTRRAGVEDREADVERYFNELCLKHRLLPLKLNIVSVRGFPDRMVLGRGRLIFFCELKRPSAGARKLQKVIGALLETMGFNFYVVTNCEEAARAIDAELYAAPVAGRGD